MFTLLIIKAIVCKNQMFQFLKISMTLPCILMILVSQMTVQIPTSQIFYKNLKKKYLKKFNIFFEVF